MPQPPTPATSRDRTRAYRARMRQRGMRRIEIWVPDVRTPEFAAEAHRQSLLLNASPHAAEDQAFIDSISIFNEALEPNRGAPQ